jgi:hypothetical protein
MILGDLSCLDCGTTEGVEYRTTPDRSDGKSFPRCEPCFERRLAHSPHISEMTSPARPSWYDEGAIGERWDED